MKVLIVDDEELTRTGLISSIDWAELGIDEVLQADDGVKGLEMAREYQPEIILSDVRMPRMSGIDMLCEVEKILPDTVSIFMSGYSDKEYLKAAIKLKTVSYIEKPLNPAEVKDAVLSAKDLYGQKQHSHQGEALQSMQEISRLALCLTSPPGADQKEVESLSEELGLSVTETTCFSCVIFRLRTAPENAQTAYSSIYLNFTEYLKNTGISCLFAEKRQQHLVYFLFRNEPVPEAELDAAFRFLCAQFDKLGEYLAAAGETGTGLSSAYASYSSAVVTLQSCFFFPNGTLLKAGPDNAAEAGPENSGDTPAEAVFSRLLSGEDENACDQFLDSLFQFYQENRTQMPNQARDLYYKLFLSLQEACRQEHVESTENIMDAIENSFTYGELHQDLTEQTHRFFEEKKSAARENSTITLIRDYIGKNYMNEQLSVKDISSHVFLSVSYVCTFFKNETGQTLNQYLTEYRMERAKELLEDSQYKIVDISAKVGYSDGNYFGKTFKKYTGLSPSEYREKMNR